jgi:nitronate monooxygenase
MRKRAQEQGSGDFSPMLAGQAAALGRELPAGALIEKLASKAQDLMRGTRS